jgi:hypothetical protein
LNTAARVAIRSSCTLFSQSVARLLAARIHLAAFSCVERELVTISSAVDRLYNIDLAYMGTLAIVHVRFKFNSLTIVGPVVVVA